jgi:uncharacterized protein YdeI (YjbR/CyaY-like superfamily)
LAVRVEKARAAAMTPRYFTSQADFRRWLETNHASARELLVGFYKKDSGKGGLTYKEAVDEALCFGWIDGIKKRVDEASYTHRFTPRRPGSIWSAINLKRMKELIANGVVSKAGLETYERRDPKKAGLYSFENRPQTFDAAIEKKFRASTRAWTFFLAQPPGYQRICRFFVMSAKKEETRLRRVERVINASSKGQRLEWMAPKKD